MATISTVSVDFVANTAKYTQGLTGMQKQTKAWSAGIKKDTKGATDAFDGVSKSLSRFATQIISVVAIQKIGASFVQAAKDVSMLADEAEKVGASAEQFYALDKAAKKFGSSALDIKIAYKEIQKSTNEALAGNKETVKSFDDLGLSFNYIAGLSPDAKFLAVADALSKVTDENKRAEIGVKLLGKSYTELAPLIAKGAFGISVAGAGGLSEKDIKTIDTVTKAFEKLGNTIDNEFKKAIVDLAPALMAIAEVAKIIVNNWEGVLVFFAVLSPTIQGYAASIIKYIGQVFSPVYFAEFAAAGGPILAAFFANIADKFITIAEIGVLTFGKWGNALIIFGSIGQQVFTALAASLVSLSAAFSGFGIGVVIIAGTVAAAFMTTLVAMQALFNGLAIALEFFDKNSKVAKEFRQSARDYKNMREDIVASVFGIDTTGNSPEVLAQRMKSANFKITQDAEKAGKALDEEANKITKLKEEGKKLFDEISKQSESITASVMTPYENADTEFNKLTLAFDLGTITINTYIRAIEKLKNSIDDVDLAKLRAVYGTGPLGVLGAYNKTGITAQTSFMQRSIKAENFGIGTNVDGGLPTGIESFTSAYEELQKQLKSTGTSLLENGRTAKEVYDTEIASINAAVEAYKLQGREEEALRLQTIALLEASNKLRDANIEAFAKANPYIIQAFGYMSDFADQLSRAIVAGESFGEALSGVFKNILKDITAMILRTTILQAIMQSIGIISPTTNAAAAFGKMTGLVPRANGGPVMAGGGYRVGERGTETFVPQTNGYILPNDMAPSETVVVNQTINVQTGVAQTVRAEMASLMPRFKADAMAGVLEAKQRGGSYARGLSFA
jgi:hypothetical protein